MPRFPRRRRPSATGPLRVYPDAESAAVAKVEQLLTWAHGLCAERENDLRAAGRRVPPWASAPDAERTKEGIIRAVSAAVSLRHRTFRPGSFSTMQPLARLAARDRSHVLDDLTTRAEILAPLVAAGCTADPSLGPFLAFLAFEHSGTPGRDNQAFGIHKEEGRPPVSRILGIAGVGPDTAVPVTARALVTGMRDDPALRTDAERRAATEAELAACGVEVASSVADHLRMELEVVREARAVVEAARARRSPATRAARMDPTEVLQRGFPEWLLAGPMQIGPLTGPRDRTAGTPYAPGLDKELLRTAAALGMRPLFQAFTGLPSGDEDADDLFYEAPNGSVFARSVAAALLGLDIDVITTLRELSAGEVAVVAQEAAESGVRFEPGVRYAIEATRRLTLGGRGQSLPVAAVMRQALGGTRVWLTPEPLTEPSRLAEAIVLAELHAQVTDGPSLSGCLGRYVTEHSLHDAQASTLRTRMALRTVTMLANIAVVGVNRARQTGADTPRTRIRP